MKTRILFLSVLACTLAGRAWSDVNVAVPFLQNGAGGRSMGMGDCYTAVADGPFASFYNPAGLGRVDSVSLGFQQDVVADLEQQEVLAANFPVGPGGLNATLEYLNYGSVQKVDASGEAAGGSLQLGDLLMRAGYGLPLGRAWRVGVNLDYYNETLGSYKLNGLAFDLGSAWDWSDQGSVAAVIKNIGPAPATGFSLPSSACLAAAYTLFDRRLQLDAEAEVPLASNTLDLGVGAEYKLWDWMALRAGYKGPFNGSALETLVVGMGFSFWNFSLDLAVTSRGDLGGQGNVSLTYAFARPEPVGKAKPAVVEEKESEPPVENIKHPVDDQSQADYHFRAGREYEHYGQLIDAIVEYKAALSVRPDFPEAQKALAAAREKARAQSQGQKDSDKTFKGEGSESLQQTIRKYYEQGLAAYKSHDYSVAIQKLQLVLELTTQHRQATELLEKAKQALDGETGTLKAQAKRGKESGDLAMEIEACRKLNELDPENKTVKIQLAAAEKKVPSTVEALYKKGVDLYAQGDYRSALRTFEQLLRLQPDHVKAKDAVASIKEKLIKTGQ